MELTNQVVNLELAKKLKELGVEKKYSTSLFNWYNEILAGKEVWKLDNSHRFQHDEKYQYYLAYSVAELGEMLPCSVKTDEEILDLWQVKLHNDNWSVCYKMTGENWSEYDQYGKTEADARAKMLIYLIENNLITL